MRLTFRSFEDHQAADEALMEMVERTLEGQKLLLSWQEARQVITLALFYREHAKALEGRVRASE